MNHQQGSIAEGQPSRGFSHPRTAYMGGIWEAYIYGRDMKNIWEGHANSKHSTPGLICQVTLPSPPFFRFSSVTDFPEEEFMRFPCGGFDRGRMCLGANVGGKNIQRVQRRLHQLSCLARCNKPKMFWLRGIERGRVQTADLGVVHPILLLTNNACAPQPVENVIN